MKDYQKPELEIITLVAQEKVTLDLYGDDFIGGDTGVSDSIFG